MKHYLISAMMSGEATQPPSAGPGAGREQVDEINQELMAAGRWVFGGGLSAPSAASVARASGDDVLMTDGPFAESKEHVAGITILTAPDLDTALEVARRYARAVGLPMEVRPFDMARER
jgi:hypothetical protein